MALQSGGLDAAVSSALAAVDLPVRGWDPNQSCSFVWRMMLVQIRGFRTLNKIILLVVGFGFGMFLSTNDMQDVAET